MTTIIILPPSSPHLPSYYHHHHIHHNHHVHHHHHHIHYHHHHHIRHHHHTTSPSYEHHHHHALYIMTAIMAYNSMIPSLPLGKPSPTPFGPHTRPSNSPCTVTQFACQNLKCVEREQVCDFKDSCGDNSDEVPCGTSCTFEDDYCYQGWRNPTGSDNTDWIRKKGPPQNYQTGPKIDHTTGTETVSLMLLFLRGNFFYIAYLR